MISANNVTLRIGKKALFEDVNIKFTDWCQWCRQIHISEDFKWTVGANKRRYLHHRRPTTFFLAAGSLQVRCLHRS